MDPVNSNGVRRTRQRSFLPKGLKALQRLAPELEMLIREAFLRGISTRQVGKVMALITEEEVSAQTVSRSDSGSWTSRSRLFTGESLKDEWAYLFLDGVWLKS